MTTDASVTKAVPIEEQSPLVEALHRRLAAAEARIGELEAALLHYGDHDATCTWRPPTAEREAIPCSCGLDAALARGTKT